MDTYKHGVVEDW